MQGSPDERLDRLEARIEELARRLDQLEAGTPPEPAPRPPAPTPYPPIAPIAAPRAEAQASRWQADVRQLDLEELLGGRVLGWIGGSAIVLGVAFFLVMAVSRGWIDEPTRVVLAFLGATALLAVGLWLYERRGQTQAALAAVGAAVAALYASLTAATTLYELISPELGLAVAALVGATATAIAVRWDARVVAGIGIVGALLAPVLVDARVSGAALAFTAFALVAAVSVLLWRRWEWLAAAAFLVSAPQLVAWADDRSNDLSLVLPVVVGFWLLYLVAAVGHEFRVPTEKLRASSAVLVLADAAGTASLGWALLDDRGHEVGATVWVLALAAAHLALGVPVAQRVQSRDFGGLMVALAIALSAVGFALALDGPALVAGWAAHAVVLAWLGRRDDDRRAAFGAAVFLGLSYVHVLAVEAPPDSLRNGVENLSDALTALATLTVASFAVAWFGLRELVPRAVPDALAAATLVYLVSVFIVETLGVAPDGAPQQDGQVALSAFWSLTGLAALVYGLVADDRRFRIGGLALLSLAVVKVFLYDLAELESIYRVLSFIALGLLLLAGAFAYQRARLGVGDEHRREGRA